MIAYLSLPVPAAPGIAVALALALIGGGVALWRQLESRRKKRVWRRRRTDFLVLQAYHLESSHDMAEIVDGRHVTVDLERLLSWESSLDHRTRCQYLTRLDAFLRLFDRLHDAVFTAETLTLDEIRPFGAYLVNALRHESLRTYCRQVGLAHVIRMADLLEADPGS
jgi:hypothetical protein